MVVFNEHNKSRQAFSLVELLAVIAIIAIMAALLLPALAGAKRKSQRIACVNNLRELNLASRMYADDNNGQLVSSWPVGFGSYPVNPYCWCPGWVSFTEPQGMDYGPDPQYNCTNVYAVQQGAIWQYLKSAVIYRCPADDRSMGGVPVVRSYSMNGWLNGKTAGDPTGASTYVTPQTDSSLTYVLFRKEDQITRPSQIWSLVEEDAKTINDGLFMVDMGPANGASDTPSDRHGKSFALGFTDGHLENVKLHAPTSVWNSYVAGPDPDWVNLKSRTTVQK